MKRYIIILIIITILLSFVSANAKTSLTPAFITTVTLTQATDLINQIQDIQDSNGPFLSNAFALANILGYPIGKSSIGAFPHFEIGASVGVGCTNMKYFNKTEKEEGTFPMIVPNPVLHFGLGLGGGFDFIGKLFFFNSAVYDIKYKSSLAAPSDYSLYSMGGRIRYNLVKNVPMVPLVFSFGGVSVSLGGDVMIGNIGVTGKYNTTFNNISITTGGKSYPIELDFSGQYDAKVSWVVYSATTQITAYFDILYVFSFYTGFGLTVGYGHFSTDFNGVGDVTTPPSTLSPTIIPANIGSLTFESKNRYSPYPLIPAYILGLEINIFIFKLNLETMVNLRNRNDVTALLGARMQF